MDYCVDCKPVVCSYRQYASRTVDIRGLLYGSIYGGFKDESPRLVKQENWNFPDYKSFRTGIRLRILTSLSDGTRPSVGGKTL